jgi:hypothetical protein
VSLFVKDIGRGSAGGWGGEVSAVFGGFVFAVFGFGIREALASIFLKQWVPIWGSHIFH